MNTKDFFDAVYCVNLKRRKERWESFIQDLPSDWPFQTVMQSSGVDGKLCPPPNNWSVGPGAWGCFRSHYRLIEDALNNGIQSLLLLEDDAVFVRDFAKKVKAFLENVPDDWGMIYLGGQHLKGHAHPPKPVAPGVVRAWNVNRTHAFALRGKAMESIYRFLSASGWDPKHHIDHRLGDLHQTQQFPVYCPDHWLVGQRQGHSDICNSNCRERMWPSAKQYYDRGYMEKPFVAVMGQHSSGSSCLAGVLYFLGVHMGNKLVGYYGKEPETGRCGYEAIGLMQLCEKAIPFPASTYRMNSKWIFNSLQSFINEKRKEANGKGTIAGGKYPLLCRMGDQLLASLGANLRVISIERDLQKSIVSIQKRCPQLDADSLAVHQSWLVQGREEWLANLPERQVFRLGFEKLLAEPENHVSRIIEFLEIQPSQQQIERAVQHVKPEMIHEIGDQK